MTAKLWMDFETYSDLDIQKVGMHKYVAHPSFLAWCSAYAVNDDEVSLWVHPDQFPDKLLASLCDSGTKIYAHGAEFERCVLGRLGHDIPYKRFVDTASLAATFGYPRGLDAFCKAMGMPVSKDVNGKKLINKLCKPQKKTIKNVSGRWFPNTAPEYFDALYKYCVQDVVVMRDAVKRLPIDELSKLEQYVWGHTAIQNKRGIKIDIASVRNIRNKLITFKERKEWEFSEATCGSVETPRQIENLKNFLYKMGLDIPNLRKETVDKYLDTPIPAVCREVLELRKQLAHSSVAKFRKMDQMCEYDGRIRGNLVYYGSHTGRFAGRGIQVHNLPRASVADPQAVIDDFNKLPYADLIEIYPNLNETASALVRPMITASIGRRLVVADYTSVENVVLHWAAGDAETTMDFRNGVDQYKTYSASRLGIPYDKVTKEQRAQSKPDVLGLGYGGGWRALISVAAGYGQVLPKGEAQSRVQFYRRKYHLIPKLWRNVFNCAKTAIATKSPQVLSTPTTRLEFRCAGGYLFILLPSGRRLSYPQVKLNAVWWIKVKGKPVKMDSEISYMGVRNGAWLRIGTHPGMMVENIIQALARDLLTYGMMCAEHSGYKIVASVHDEAIAESACEDPNEFCELLCLRQPWAESIPLRADGYIADRYRKD